MGSASHFVAYLMLTLALLSQLSFASTWACNGEKLEDEVIIVSDATASIDIRSCELVNTKIIVRTDGVTSVEAGSFVGDIDQSGGNDDTSTAKVFISNSTFHHSTLYVGGRYLQLVTTAPNNDEPVCLVRSSIVLDKVMFTAALPPGLSPTSCRLHMLLRAREGFSSHQSAIVLNRVEQRTQGWGDGACMYMRASHTSNSIVFNNTVDNSVVEANGPWASHFTNCSLNHFRYGAVPSFYVYPELHGDDNSITRVTITAFNHNNQAADFGQWGSHFMDNIFTTTSRWGFSSMIFNRSFVLDFSNVKSRSVDFTLIQCRLINVNLTLTNGNFIRIRVMTTTFVNSTVSFKDLSYKDGHSTPPLLGTILGLYGNRELTNSNFIFDNVSIVGARTTHPLLCIFCRSRDDPLLPIELNISVQISGCSVFYYNDEVPTEVGARHVEVNRVRRLSLWNNTFMGDSEFSVGLQTQVYLDGIDAPLQPPAPSPSLLVAPSFISTLRIHCVDLLCPKAEWPHLLPLIDAVQWKSIVIYRFAVQTVLHISDKEGPTLIPLPAWAPSPHNAVINLIMHFTALEVSGEIRFTNVHYIALLFRDCTFPAAGTTDADAAAIISVQNSHLRSSGLGSFFIEQTRYDNPRTAYIRNLQISFCNTTVDRHVANKLSLVLRGPLTNTTVAFSSSLVGGVELASTMDSTSAILFDDHSWSPRCESCNSQEVAGIRGIQ